MEVCYLTTLKSIVQWSVIYITSLTRPDISFAVEKLSQYMHQPTFEHWNAAKRVLCYLAGTANAGIFLRRSNTLSLHAVSDAD